MTTVTSALVKFWDDESADIHPSRLRKDIPPLPKVNRELQTVYGGAETLAFLVWQVRKTSEKAVVVRAIASAAAILYEDESLNYTGSPLQPHALQGLGRITADDITDRGEILRTNFLDESEVSIQEMDSLMEVDPDEMGSYFGVLCLAAVKALTTKNRSAYNEKRLGAVQATTIGDPKIFVADSPFLTDAIIQKVYASFNSYLPVRTHIVHNVAQRLGRTVMGPTLAFTTMFLLLVDQGMSALRIIKEAVVKHRWIVDEFPEIHAELRAAQEGFNSISKAAPADRSFLKAMHGPAYVPVAYSSIKNLTGLCKFVLKETTISYANYEGGEVTEAQEAKLVRIMMERGLMKTVERTAVIQE